MMIPRFGTSLLVALASILAVLSGAEPALLPDTGRCLLRASFDGRLEAESAAGSPQARTAGPLAYVDSLRGKAVLLGADTQVAYPLAGNLQPASGTLSFWLKPVGWSGNDGRWHYLVTLTGEDDWILLQTDANNLVFLGGRRRAYSQNAAPIGDWAEGQWRFVTVTWDQGRNRIYLDGRPASDVTTWPSVPTDLGEEIRLGGQLYQRAPGHLAMADLQIRDASLGTEQVRALYLAAIKDIPGLRAQHEFLEQQQTPEPRNVATPAGGAIILPSSQSASAAFAVENAVDRDFGRRWLSAPGTFPNWVEVRWPQPVTLDRLVVNEALRHQTAQYRVDAYRQGRWVTLVPPQANARQPGERIVETFAPAEVTKLRYVMLAPADGDPQTACSSIIELQACSAEPVPDLTWIARPAWKSSWIWFPEEPASDITRCFRAHFRLADTASVRRAAVQLGADDTFELWLNGRHVGSGGIPTERFEVGQFLQPGDNLIAVKCHQFSGFAGLICELTLTHDDGTVTRVLSDRAWLSLNREPPDWRDASADESAWVPSREFGVPPDCPDHRDQPYFAEGAKEGFRVLGVRVSPPDARPGEAVEVSLQMAVPRALQLDYGFLVRIGERPVSPAADFTVARKTFLPSTPTSQWPAGEAQALTTRVHLPEWAPHGSFPLFLTPVGHEAEGCLEGLDDGAVGQVTIRRFATAPKPWSSRPPRARVRTEGGRPALFVNGKLLPAQLLTENTNPSYQAFGEQARTGIHFWRIYAARGRDSRFHPDDKPRERAELCAVFDHFIECLLKVDPEAYVLAGTTFDVSQEWTDRYPDDATLLADGHRIQHSFSSRRWAAETQEDAAALVRHLLGRPYAGHVVGLHFGIGAGPETYYWGMNANPFGTPREKLLLGDFSPEHLRAFRAWLRERYHDDPQALQAAWHDPAVDFETAQPDLEVLRREDMLAFRDPARSRLPFDYWEFHSAVMARRAVEIAEAIKGASDGRYITGFWGLYSGGMNALTSIPGHLQHCAYAGLQQALESPAIDYLAMLQEYLNVRWGTPMIPVNLTESIRRHGKLCLIEYDMRTFFTPLEFTERTFSQPETLSVMRRNLAAAVVHGDACWWVGFPQGTTGRMSVPWYAEDSLLDALAAGRRVYAAASRQDRSSVAEVAAFVSNADVYALDVMRGHPLLASAQYNTFADEFSQLGAPVDLYHLDDIARKGMDRYKVFVFLNAFNLSESQRRSITAVVRRQGRTAVWLYAPGFCDGAQLSVASIEALTGFRVGYAAEACWPEVVVEQGHELTAGWTTDVTVKPIPYRYFAGEFTIGPLFHLDDPAAEVLGRYAHNGKAAYATKMLDGGSRSVYLAIPYLSVEVLRGVCRAAGVHLYSERDVYLDASRSFITITSTADGFRGEIALPRPATLCDAFAPRVLAEDVARFEAVVPPLTTALYFYGSAAQARAFLAAARE